MPLNILIVAATRAEAEILNSIPGIRSAPEGFSYKHIDIIPLITGVGPVATSWALTKRISSGSRPDLALNVGIAGSYRDDLNAGDVVMPITDCFADSGIETVKGFLTLAEAGLEDPDAYPFRSERIFAENKYVSLISGLVKPVNAVTVSMATGSENRIRALVDKYNPDIETMEGAAFFYVCSRENIPFAAVRSISNRVEKIRDKKNWNIPLALTNLAAILKDVLLLL